jgi:hypothetical protein
VIADMVNRKGDAWPTVLTVADRCEISDRMVRKHLSLASKLGVIQVERESGKRSSYSFPTPEQYDRGNNMTGVKNSSDTPEQYDTPPLYKNRKGTVSINKRARETEKKSIPEWAKIINDVAGFCGGESLTNQHIQNIEERHTHIDLKTEALGFEDHHITKHRQKPYKTFATYSRFSTTWLGNTTKGFRNVFNGNGVPQTDTDNAATRPVGAPSPLL